MDNSLSQEARKLHEKRQNRPPRKKLGLQLSDANFEKIDMLSEKHGVSKTFIVNFIIDEFTEGRYGNRK